MILSDRDIRKAIDAQELIIDPFDDAMVQPSSIDLHVDAQFRVFNNSRYPFIDVRSEMEDLTSLVEVGPDEPFILHPGEFVLGSTYETVTLPDYLVARLEGKSSLGRLGLLIHSTAGFVDAGWSGHLTLELSNVANLPITIYPGMKIGQLCLFEMTSPAERSYALTGKYQGQRGPTASRFYMDFREWNATSERARRKAGLNGTAAKRAAATAGAKKRSTGATSSAKKTAKPRTATTSKPQTATTSKRKR